MPPHSHRREGRRARLVSGMATAALVLALALSAGCGGGADATSEGGEPVQGLVVEVVGRSITELDTLRVRDEDGKVWTFTSGEGFVGFTPSHLRQHQLLGHAVRVTYVVRGDTLVVVSIAD